MNSVFYFIIQFLLQGDKMIIDVTGVELTPGLCGKDCLGNGNIVDESGNYIECCCEECDYLQCCMDSHNLNECNTCNDVGYSSSKSNI